MPPKKENISISMYKVVDNCELGFILTMPLKDLCLIRKDRKGPNDPYHIYISSNFPLTSSPYEILGKKYQNQHKVNKNTILQVECSRSFPYGSETMSYSVNIKGNYYVKKLESLPKYDKTCENIWVEFTTPLDYVEFKNDPVFCKIQIYDSIGESYKLPQNAETHVMNNEELPPITIIIYVELPAKILEKAETFAFNNDLPLYSIIRNIRVNVVVPKSKSLLLFYNNINSKDINENEENIHDYAQKIIDNRGFFSVKAFNLFTKAIEIVFRSFVSEKLILKMISHWASNCGTDFDLAPFKSLVKKLLVTYKLYLTNGNFYSGDPIINEFSFVAGLPVYLMYLLSKASDYPISCYSWLTYRLDQLTQREFIEMVIKRCQNMQKRNCDVDYKKYLKPFVENNIISEEFLDDSKTNEDLEMTLPENVVDIIDAIFSKCTHCLLEPCSKLQCDYLEPEKTEDFKAHSATCKGSCYFCRRFKDFNKLADIMMKIMQQ